MSQHDMDLANQTRSAFRTDLNAALVAIVGASSGATEPATKFAYQFWADTTTGILKQRNAANTAWISILTLSSGAALLATDTVAKTGTGSTYVTNTSPTLVTPNLGTPSALVGTNITGTAAGLSIGGNAANVTGTVAVANGGTGQTTVAGILSTLGLRPSSASWKALTFAFGTTYQNTYSYEIVIAVYGTNGSSPQLQISSDNVNWFTVFYFQAAGSGCVVPVPAGHYYKTTVGGGVVNSSSVLS